MRFAFLLCVACSAPAVIIDDPAPSDPPPYDPPVTEPAHGPADTTKALGSWIKVDAGTFVMSRATDACRGPNEKEHTITLTHDFEMTATEVTQGEWTTVMGSNASFAKSCGADCPADTIHWHMAAAYCNALSERTGATACYTCNGKGSDVRCTETLSSVYGCRGYRLPTEAEWEYAYRAGTETTLYTGALSVCTGEDPNLVSTAWYRFNGEAHSHPSKSKAPNPWGFYDLSGNVWEWQSDYFKSDLGNASVTDPITTTGEMRSIRGGSYNCEANEVRGGHRTSLPPVTPGLNVGFRCARTL